MKRPRPKLVASPVKPKVVSLPTAGIILGGVNTKTVSRLVQRGKIRGVKVGTRSMVISDSIDDYLAEAEAEAEAVNVKTVSRLVQRGKLRGTVVPDDDAYLAGAEAEAE